MIGCMDQDVFTLHIANLLEILLEEFEELEETLLKPGLVLPVNTNQQRYILGRCNGTSPINHPKFPRLGI